MATYKVLQDIEAEDKLLGPLSLRQFIYAGIAATCGYLTFLAITRHAPFMAVLFVPIMIFTGFFAFPWGKDQPTEVWALAKIRFLLKPRKRIWDQSGVKELVTVTVPKKIERMLTNGLDQDEVRSRLSALASTIDSRGWAVKNVNINMYAQPSMAMGSSDRLVVASAFPQEVSNVDVRPSDDILDESANPVAHHFDDMIHASTQARHQQLVAQMQQPAAIAPTPQTGQPAATNDYWFMQQPAPNPTAPVGHTTFVNAAVVAPGTPSSVAAEPQAAVPTAEEQAMVEQFKAVQQDKNPTYGHMKKVKTLEEQMADEARANLAAAQAKAEAARKAVVTPSNQAAIMNLARNDDLDVATIARQMQKPSVSRGGDDGEVVVSLR